MDLAKTGHGLRLRLALPALVALIVLASGVASAGAARPGGIGTGGSLTRQMILIHGGSFLFEDPTFQGLTEGPARQAGFVTHYLEYPLGDMPAAVRAARAEALSLRASYGAEAVFAYGTSAGGTLAALLAGEGLVAAAVAKAPISDLLDWEWPLGVYGPEYFEQIGLDPEQRRDLSPLRRPDASPLLIIHGRGDQVVPVGMSRKYAAKFRRVRLWVVEGGHHTERRRPQLLRRAFAWLAHLAR